MMYGRGTCLICFICGFILGLVVTISIARRIMKKECARNKLMTYTFTKHDCNLNNSELLKELESEDEILEANKA